MMTKHQITAYLFQINYKSLPIFFISLKISVLIAFSKAMSVGCVSALTAFLLKLIT